MLNNSLRSLFRLVFSVLGVMACCLVNLWLFLGNYMGLQLSFLLLGWDRMPIARDSLIGNFFQDFFPGTTIAQLFALVIASVVALGLFFVFNSGMRTIDLIADRRFYLRTGDKESAAVASETIFREFFLFLLLVGVLVYVIHWDLDLFRFRSIAGARQFETADMAAHMLSWPIQMKNQGRLWAWTCTQAGSWGYLAMTAASCLLVEISIRKTAQSWTSFISPIDQWIEGGAGHPDELVHSAPSVPRRGVDQGEIPDAQGTEGVAEARSDTPLFGSLEHETDRGQKRPDSMTREPEEQYKVIGAPDAPPLSVREALVDRSRFWVDPETHTIWDANYRKSLFGEKDVTKEAAEEKKHDH